MTVIFMATIFISTWLAMNQTFSLILWENTVILGIFMFPEVAG
jgi:hypothetical protein